MYNYTHFDAGRCEFIGIGSPDELRSGERLFVEINDLQIVIFNIAERLYAIGDLCTHDDGPLGDGELDSYDIACPRHGARFDVRTGKALSLPAVVDIPAYPIRINDGQIEIGIPIESLS